MSEKGLNEIRKVYEAMMLDASHGISWSHTSLGWAAMKLERDYRKECVEIEPLVRRAAEALAVDARNGSGEADRLCEIADRWMFEHGFAPVRDAKDDAGS